jgi:hypothetical protein
VSLVPVFQQCGTVGNVADGQHSSPLSTPACLPPSPTSANAAVGSAYTGTASIEAVPDNPLTGADEADFNYVQDQTDVRAGTPGGADYGSDLTAAFRLRITDTRNCAPASCSGPYDQAGTTADVDFSVPIDCVATPGPEGATCSVDTSANAVQPGAVTGGDRSILQVFRVRVNDAGANGIRGDGDDDLFAQQGVYVP